MVPTLLGWGGRGGGGGFESLYGFLLKPKTYDIETRRGGSLGSAMVTKL